MSKESLAVKVVVLLWSGLWLCCAKEMTEGQLYQSSEWGDGSRLLVFTKPGSVPPSFLESLLAAAGRNTVAHFKVTCPQDIKAGNVCETLANHRMAVRVGGAVKGVATPPQGYTKESAFVAAVLEQLLASRITELTTYSDLVEYTSVHPQHLLLLAPDTASEEYATLLSAILTQPLPLAVAVTANVLPLSRRPNYSRNPPALQLWCIVQHEHGQAWYRFQDSGFFFASDWGDGKPFNQLVSEFVERFKYPIIVGYEDDATLKRQFSGSGLHLAVIFPGLSGASDIHPVALATEVAQKTFTDYAFVLADRSLHSDYGRRLFVTDNKPLPHVVLLPYGREENYIGIDLDGQDVSVEAQRVVGVMDSFLNDYPKTSDGFEDYSELGPSMTVVSVLTAMANEKKYHILGYFCLADSDDCINQAYSIVRDVLSVVRRVDLGRSLSAHVIQCQSEKDVLQFELDELPGCALYNKTTSKWRPITVDISSNTNIVRFLSEVTGLSELEGIAETLFNGPPSVKFTSPPPPPPPLREEDHLNLVARSLKRPSIPSEIQLTSTTFDLHISKFLRTAVVFCVKWSIRCKVFYHHVMAAHNHLDKALNVSLATVGCDEFTDLCTRFHITTYPTVLVFTPSTLHSPQPLAGALDSTHLLAALGQSSAEREATSLTELTPSSLPSLLSDSGLEKTVVLWCDKDTTSKMAKAFVKESSSNVASTLAFFWINSTKQSTLLSRMLPSAAAFPTVVAVNFKQRTVHLLPADNMDIFEEKLTSFLTALHHGTLEASGRLGEGVWLPLQPPVPFPSPDYESDDFPDEQDFGDSPFHHEDYHGNDDGFYDHEPMMEHATKPHPHAPPTTSHRHHHTEL